MKTVGTNVDKDEGEGTANSAAKKAMRSDFVEREILIQVPSKLHILEEYEV
jgi:hypothetical protein